MLVVSHDDHGSGREWGMGSPVPEIGEVVELSLNSMKVNEGTIAEQVVVVVLWSDSQLHLCGVSTAVGDSIKGYP